MNVSFYTAAVGAAEQQDRLDVHGNNIANVNTFGFRAGKPTFTQLMYSEVQGIEGDLPCGTGSRLDAADTDFRGSGLHETGLEYDYAIQGHGFFCLLDPATGEYSYTRDGSFTAAHFGNVWYLSDGNGRQVLDQSPDGNPINGRPIEVNVSQVNAPGNPLNVGIYDFINYNGMRYLGDNRFLNIDKNGQPVQGMGTLVQGYVEKSNADFANEITKVIETQRSFTYMIKMIITSDEIETTVNQLR